MRASRKTLAEIGRWRARPDFPAKSAKGYLRAEIIAWVPKFLRENEPLQLARDLLHGKVKPTARLLERLEGAGGGGPATVRGQPAIAAIICNAFGIRCQRMDVQKWRERAPEPFPAPDENNAYTVAACLDWVRKWVLPNRNGNDQTPDLFQKAAIASAQGEIETEEHERWKRELERKQWIKLEQHRRELVSSGRRYHQIARRIETEPARQAAEQLREAGVAPEIIARVGDILRRCGIEIVTDIERECAAIAKG